MKSAKTLARRHGDCQATKLALARPAIAERRAQYERAEKVFPTPPEIKVEHVSAPAALTEWLRPPGAVAGRVMLYLHGGGYVIGSPFLPAPSVLSCK